MKTADIQALDTIYSINGRSSDSSDTHGEPGVVITKRLVSVLRRNRTHSWAHSTARPGEGMFGETMTGLLVLKVTRWRAGVVWKENEQTYNEQLLALAALLNRQVEADGRHHDIDVAKFAEAYIVDGAPFAVDIIRPAEVRQTWEDRAVVLAKVQARDRAQAAERNQVHAGRIAKIAELREILGDKQGLIPGYNESTDVRLSWDRLGEIIRAAQG